MEIYLACLSKFISSILNVSLLYDTSDKFSSDKINISRNNAAEMKRYSFFSFSSGHFACRYMLDKLVFIHNLRPVDHSNERCTSRQSVHGSGSFDISRGA